MPSGAKKRKAAKKKQASNSNSVPPPSSSSTSHSQSGDDDLKHHDGRDSDGEELEKRDDSSSDQSFVSKGKSNQGENTGKADDEEGIVQIDWDLKPEEDYDSSKKKSDDGSSSGSSSSNSSSSSSSDDESHVVEKKIVVVEDAPVTVDLVEPLDSFPEKATQKVDDLVKNINPLSEADNLAVHVVDSVSIENCSSSHVADTFRKVNDVKKLPSLDKNSVISSVMMDLGSKSEDEEKRIASVGYEQYLGPPTDAIAKETEANPCNGGGNVEESHSQPLVASAPRTVQTTSWKSCCGIFELFTGSNR